jgi:bifunctional non-homologous end joining protein LigD
MKNASLYYREGSSDKVYHATVEEMDGGYVVNFEYGRRGARMNTGSKTSRPVSQDKAVKIWTDLVESKLAKGYRHMTEASHGTIPQAPPETPTEALCVLLNPVEEEEALGLLNDPKWAAQPKFDGVRFMLGHRKGIYALNRKGKTVSIPNEIAQEAALLGEAYLLDGELVGDTLHVFDILEHGDCVRTLPVEERSSMLLRLTSCIRAEFGEKAHIKFAPLHTGKEKKLLHDRLVRENGEGMVFKRLGSPYNKGRPASGGNYLKHKFYSTASCRVSKANLKRSVSLVMACGKEVGNVTIPANHEVPKKGDIVEIRYLYAYRGGSLYQPTYLGKRDDVDPDRADSLKFKNEED